MSVDYTITLCMYGIWSSHVVISYMYIKYNYTIDPKEVGHEFHGKWVKLSCTIGNVLLLLTQWYGQVCVDIYYCLLECNVISDQPPLLLIMAALHGQPILY